MSCGVPGSAVEYPDSDLRSLAALYGIQTEYRDVHGGLRQASSEALHAILHALGAPVGGAGDLGSVLEHRSQELNSRCLEPVTVCWSDERAGVLIRLPADFRGTIDCRLTLQGGSLREWHLDPSALYVVDNADSTSKPPIRRRIDLGDDLPVGYHRLTVEFDGRAMESTVIAAPHRAFQPENQAIWGAFLPLYSVHGPDSHGIGSYSELNRLAGWVGDRGGDLFGTLPLLATFLNEPFDPSPYAPVSRRFWNEIFLDIALIPELNGSVPARRLLESDTTRQTLADLGSSGLVDYRRVAALKRGVLHELTRTVLNEPSARRDAFKSWVENNPLARVYARFMATVDREQRSWLEWPERQRQGKLTEGDFDQLDLEYHLYVQWLAEDQLRAVANDPTAANLYLDLPLGVHRDGFDVWQERERFAVDVRVGAPPDPLSWDGQDWGFPPLHPERVREDGYDYFRQCIQHHLKFAGALRIDHIMGLHRLFWIPPGLDARDGVYVQYQAEELYAVLTLESHRHQAMLIGEDLGTVPEGVRETMSTHGLSRMYIVPFEIGGEHEPALRDQSPGSLAALNTHDMPPFATGWSNLDDWARQRVVSFLREQGWLAWDADDTGSIFKAILACLATGPAGVVLVNLEDLWQEVESQNVPGTIDEHPNWRRKARFDLDAITTNAEFNGLLDEVDRLRQQGR